MRSDKYYGRAASEYEAQRSGKRMWHDEHEALKSMLRAGPVVDVPCGTGRFFPIYQDLGLPFIGADISKDMLAQAEAKHPGANILEASIFDLPNMGLTARTAVCVRLLHWLDASEMVKAIRCLRAIADEVIVTVGFGLEGYAEYNTVDHDKNHFLEQFQGLMHRRIFLQENKGRNRWYMYHFWRPTWHDVLEQFLDRDQGTIQRLTNVWCKRFHVEQFAMSNRPVTCEYWSPNKIRRVIEDMHPHEPDMITDKSPRRSGPPLTAIRTEGRDFFIDGRKRANRAMRGKDVVQVLVIHG